jgi:hypothetical protein
MEKTPPYNDSAASSDPFLKKENRKEIEISDNPGRPTKRGRRLGHRLMGLVWSRLQIFEKWPRALETPGSNPGDPTIFSAGSLI